MKKKLDSFAFAYPSLIAFTAKMIEEFKEGIGMDEIARATAEGMPEPKIRRIV